MKTRTENILIALVIFSLPVLLYLNSLPATTLWEDDGLILDNRVIRDPWKITILFSPSFWSSYHLASFKDYRPLGFSTFIVDNFLLGGAVKTYRAVNIVIYGFICLLLYALVRNLLSSRRSAYAAALLFASHPVHVEAVVWLKNRAELLAALLMLASCIFFAKFCLSRSRRGALLTASIVTAGLAFLSKESALILPLILCAILIFLRREKRTGTGAAVLLPYLAAGGAFYLFTRLSTTHGRTGDAFSYLPSPLSRAALAVKTIGGYARLLLLPTDLSIQHVSPTIGQAMDYEFLFSAMAVAVFALVLLASLRRHRFLAFSLAWTALCLLPVANIVFMLPGRPVAEQRLFIPSAGFCMAAACIVCAGKSRRSRWVPLAAIVLCYGILTVNRNGDWADRRRLMEQATTASPGSWKPWISLSLIALEEGRYDEAFLYARGPVTRYPALTEPYRNMGVLYGRIGHLKKAEGYYRLALKVDPEDYLAHNGLGSIYTRAGKYGLARQEYRASLGSWPQPAPVLANIGWTYEKEGRPEEAVRYYRKAIRSYPDYKKAYCDLGRVLYKMKKREESGRAFEEALTIDGEYAPAHRGLGEIELARERYEKAREHFGRSLALSPDDGEVLNSIAISYKREGKLREAFPYNQRALASSPMVRSYLDSLLDTYHRIGDTALKDELGRTVVESSRKCLAFGHPEKARAYLEVLLQTDRGNEEARKMITRLHSSSGGDY